MAKDELYNKVTGKRPNIPKAFINNMNGRKKWEKGVMSTEFTNAALTLLKSSTVLM